MSSFYAVSLASNVPLPDPLPVFDNLNDAQKAVKQWPGSRLKKFCNRDEAENFARSRFEFSSDQQPNTNLEAAFASNFKAPSPSELSAFRRAIQTGDLDFVKSCVAANPRYLISSGDCAVIIMEGPRYNAAHVACKANRHEILSFILQTVNDPSFIRLHYTSDSQETARERADILLASYLNTPDKSANDTPLHFACKFGAVECAKILLSYPQCVVNQPNKLSMTPAQVICSRANGKIDEKKAQLQEIFESTYYIPILRTDDSVKIGEPQRKVDSPNVKALAGPLSPENADRMYKFLKTPDRTSPLTKVRYTDSQKGVEKMARVKCRQLNCSLIESWPFLETESLIDLASKEGLDMLEGHFRKVAQELNSAHQIDTDELCQTLNSLYISSDSKRALPHSLTLSPSPLASSTSRETTDSGDDTWFTPPTSPSEALIYTDYFVYGCECTSWDLSAYDKLVDCELIGKKSYPLVYAWFTRMQKLPQKRPKNQKRLQFDELNHTF